MGKESEVLQAAQDGNVPKLESLFTPRQPKMLAGLFKGPNINWRDDSGCTALHLAALNGHNGAVVFLLQNDGSANIPDNAGSFPLHLAAFNGHYEVAKTLLTRGPSRAQVNEANMAGDTAMHVAAQYGHRFVVQVLLENHAEPHLRNTKEETALDLAAQYGRILTVQLFLVFNVKLLQDAVHKHSPLHLAARNGHEDVCRVLLDGGMPINATCDMGTALHCAALCGKVAVAKLLLQRGIDIDIEDDNGEKVLDVLCKHPSQRSQEITALVYEHSGAGFNKEVEQRSPVSTYSGHNFEVVETKERTKSAPTNSKNIIRPAGYDFVPPPRPKPKNLDEDSYEEPDRTYSILHGPVREESNRFSNNDDNFDLASMTPLDDTSRDSFFSNSRTNNNTNTYSVVGEVKDTKPRNETETNRPAKNTDDGTYTMIESKQNSTKQGKGLSLFSSKPLTSKTKITNIYPDTSQDDSIYQVPPNSKYAEHKSSPATVQQNNTSVSKVRSQTMPVIPSAQHQPDIYDNINLTNTSSEKNQTSTSQELYDNVNLSNSSLSQDVYDNVNLSNSPVTSQSYDNVHITNKESQSIKPSAGLTQDSYYQSPPCTVLQDKPSDLFTKQSETNTPQYTTVKTKSMKQKRTTIIKRDISLEATKEIPIDEPSTKQNSEVRSVDKPLEKNESVNSVNSDLQSNSTNRPNPVNENKEPVTVEFTEKKASKPRKVKQNRTSVRSVSSGYRMSLINKEIPLDESYEWNKIDHFLTDLEQFADTPENESPPVITTSDVASWLLSLGLVHYEPMFLTNGFDDMKYLNGVIEDSDLIEMGILDSIHRKKLLEECDKLPRPPIIGEDNFPLPQTVGEWLKHLKLKEYEERFNYNGYGNIDRVRVIWELELVTVLDITTLGHRKRMLHSLGRRPPVIKSDVSWAKRFADADAGRQKHVVTTDNSMEVARKLLETAESLKVDRKNRQVPDNGNAAPPIPARKDLEEEAPKSSTAPSIPAPTTKPMTPDAKSTTTTVTTTTTSKEVVGRNTKESVSSAPASETNWKHCADTLLYESVAYKTQYLGSHPVQQVRGVSSTLDACKKMKAISRNVHKMPSITLSISVRGIDYIDSNSKIIISQYAINHISFCAQDPTDLHMFAYITRDQQTKKNYCHVFRAASINLADEIIMTIGQCFELAYEQHMAILEMKKMKESLMGSASDNGNTQREPPPKPVPYAERMAQKNDSSKP